MCKNRVIYGFLNTSWVLLNMAARNRVFPSTATKQGPLVGVRVAVRVRVKKRL